MTLNYNRPFINRIKTSLYANADYDESEVKDVDIYYTIKYNEDNGYDGNNLPFGEGYYDYIPNTEPFGYKLVDRFGNTYNSRPRQPLHKYKLNTDTRDHITILYDRGIVSNAFQVDMYTYSNLSFRFRGVIINVIPRRVRSTFTRKGVR